MFEKYSIDDLYLASVSICYPKIEGTNFKHYSYTTILRRENEKYTDLRHPLRKIELERNPKKKSFIINYMEPLNKFYNQDGERVTKKEAMMIIKSTLY